MGHAALSRELCSLYNETNSDANASLLATCVIFRGEKAGRGGGDSHIPGPTVAILFIYGPRSVRYCVRIRVAV